MNKPYQNVMGWVTISILVVLSLVMLAASMLPGGK
jgi:hypothetical protein